MITVEAQISGQAVLSGPQGRILIRDLVWLPLDRQDILEIYYWHSWWVTQGVYHCCFSIPGKVSLLKEQEPAGQMS